MYVAIQIEYSSQAGHWRRYENFCQELRCQKSHRDILDSPVVVDIQPFIKRSLHDIEREIGKRQIVECAQAIAGGRGSDYRERRPELDVIAIGSGKIGGVILLRARNTGCAKAI